MAFSGQRTARTGAGTSTLWRAVVAGAVVLAAYAHFNVIWNHYYAGVPKLFDTGWYADLVFRQTPALRNPGSVVFGTIQEHFYATHFSPGLWLLSLPSFVLAVDPPLWLALVEGVKHALVPLCVSLSMASAASRADGPGKPIRRVGSSRGAARYVIMLTVAFNGPLLAAAAYPHFETWFIPGALAFCYLLFRRHYIRAAVVMALTLSIREDMGFHLFGILLLAAAFAAWERRTVDLEIRRWLLFAAGAFVFSCIGIVVTATLFPGDNAFGRIYLGDPPYAHVSAAFLKERIGYIFAHRSYLWWPALVYLVWAVVQFRWWVLIGYFAFVPWFLLHVLSFHQAAGTLELYYAFPYAFSVLWPLVGTAVFDRGKWPGASGYPWVAAALVGSTAGFWMDARDRSVLTDMLAPSLTSREPVKSTAHALGMAVREGLVVAVDDAVAAHAARQFSARNLYGQTPEAVDVAAAYRNGRQTQIAWETARVLPFHYRVEHAPVSVISRHPLRWSGLEPVSEDASSILAFLSPGPAADDSFVWPAGAFGEAGVPWRISAGPHWFLPGRHRRSVEFRFRVEASSALEEPVVCAVAVDGGEQVLARLAVPPEEWNDGKEITRTLVFQLPARISKGIEFHLWAPAGSSGRLIDVRLREHLDVPQSETGFEANP